MSSAGLKRALPAVLAVAMLAALAGCGSDSSGDTSTAASISIPSPTSPIPTASVPSTTTGGGKKNGQATTTTASGGSASCSIPDAYGNFKFTGIDCTAAVAVATAWDQDAKDCNTVDNPNVDAGYHRTCSVEGFTCTAKRDIHSDARFVACAQGGQSVRFTWLPA
ncbi:MAG TPA: hypothetical protein VFY30_08380 [Solirubrobacterales bacterium]|nr:hypothetical protein [Solirubrobacterales bacterium]